MRLLIDTHALLWLLDDRRLSATAAKAFLQPDAQLFLSVASYWEICIKVSLGKLQVAENWPDLIQTEMMVNDIHWLPIEPRHCREVIALPHHHRDPFDRLLVAQARLEGLTLLSADPNLGGYDVTVVW